MTCQLHLLNADGRLDAWQTRIRAAFHASLPVIAARLPVGDVDVIVYDDAEQVVPELGMSGLCTSPRRLYLPLDTGHPALPQTFETVFQAFLGHELHHVVRRRQPGFADTLGQALVSEGLACSFEAELPGGAVPLYATRVSGPALETVRRRAQAVLHDPLSGWGDWFFGEREPEIPLHAGYALGHALVAAWLQHTGQRASTACAVSAAEVLGWGWPQQAMPR